MLIDCNRPEGLGGGNGLGVDSCQKKLPTAYNLPFLIYTAKFIIDHFESSKSETGYTKTSALKYEVAVEEVQKDIRTLQNM